MIVFISVIRLAFDKSPACFNTNKHALIKMFFVTTDISSSVMSG